MLLYGQQEREQLKAGKRKTTREKARSRRSKATVSEDYSSGSVRERSPERFLGGGRLGMILATPLATAALNFGVGVPLTHACIYPSVSRELRRNKTDESELKGMTEVTEGETGPWGESSR